jgi:hypothetical protein
MKEIEPISKASFVLAFVEEHPWSNCKDATTTWEALHVNLVHPGEIDEDP